MYIIKILTVLGFKIIIPNLQQAILQTCHELVESSVPLAVIKSSYIKKIIEKEYEQVIIYSVQFSAGEILRIMNDVILLPG